MDAYDMTYNVFCFLKARIFIFFWIRGNLTLRKAYFMGSGERVKSRLSQAFTKGARPDSNSRPAVQISSLLSSCYAYSGL